MKKISKSSISVTKLHKSIRFLDSTFKNHLVHNLLSLCITYETLNWVFCLCQCVENMLRNGRVNVNEFSSV